MAVLCLSSQASTYWIGIPYMQDRSCHMLPPSNTLLQLPPRLVLGHVVGRVGTSYAAGT